MKRILVGLVALIMFVSCTQVTSPPAAIDTGRISITISPSLNRGLTNQQSSTLCDVYEVAAYKTSPGTTSVYSAILSVGSETTLVVPIGTYNIVVLAGVNASPESVKMSYLLGTARATDLVVSADSVTPVTLVLQSVDMSLTVPSEVVDVTKTTSYPVSATFDTRLTQVFPSRIDVSLTGANYSGVSQYSIQKSGMSDSVVSFSGNIAAPTTASTAIIEFVGGDFVIEDSGFSGSLSITSGFQKTWLVPVSWIVSLLEPDIKKAVNFVATTQTGLKITLGWGS